MTRWGEIKCPRCAELEAKLRESALQELAALGQASEAYQAQKDAEAKLAEADGALNICSASWGECSRVLDETKDKLALVIAAYRIEAMRRDDYSHDAFDHHIAALETSHD